VNHSIFAEVRVLPEVVDFSLITDTAGVCAVAFTMLGAVLRYDRDRLARFTLFGTVLGGGAGAMGFLIALTIDVL
jgi:hypothetical protein